MIAQPRRCAERHQGEGMSSAQGRLSKQHPAKSLHQRETRSCQFGGRMGVLGFLPNSDEKVCTWTPRLFTQH